MLLHRRLLFTALFFWGIFFTALATSRDSNDTPLRRVTPILDSLNTGYYVVDSDDPISTTIRPWYNFVDTVFLPASWHRIYPGPNSIPAGKPPVCWHNINGDSTDNTFAGPIPIGFHFNFYSVNYDSVYLSSNGYIGFGNFLRASGNDGPGYTSKVPTCTPDPSLPKAIAAFLMTDGEMVRSKYDSSRAYYRTSSTQDSFFISIYNYFHASGASTNGTQHLFRADIQIVIAKADSSITFQYRKFYGTVVIGLNTFAAQNIFRIGCIPTPCSSNASLIGVQNETQTAGTNYMCNGAFTSAGSTTDLHNSLAVKFKRYSNAARAEQIIFPTRNFEIMAGDSLAPVAEFRNLLPVAQTLKLQVHIRNIATDSMVYASPDSAPNAATGTFSHTFPKFYSSKLDALHASGAFLVEAIVQAPAGTDGWPLDDTARTIFYVLQRQQIVNQHWSDFGSTFTPSPRLPSVVPDAAHWISNGATIVDGDQYTYSPPPPRGVQGDPTVFQMMSPVTLLDRLDANSNEYDHCAFSSATGGGTAISPATPVGSGGTGDTLISFPIDCSKLTTALFSFSYERSGKRTYPRWYDLATLVGPERTVVSADSSIVYRYGDSLELDFADPTDSINISSWKEIWSADGGKDFYFTRVEISVPANYLTNHFRFRFRLKGKNDNPAGNPADDADAWYIDNFEITDPKRAEIEVTDCRISTTWPYERVPASQAVAVPLEVSITNNGGNQGGAFGIATIINVKGAPPTTNPSGVYAKLVTIPVLSPGQTTVINFPTWNARTAGPGQYSMSSFVIPKQFDLESNNDSTYFDFAMLFDSSYVYDNGSNDIPASFQIPGLGLTFADTGSVGGHFPLVSSTGSIAVRFTIFQPDTILGAQLWFASYSQAPTPIRISILTNKGNLPGPLIADTCATVVTTRQPPWDNWSMYHFPCEVIILQPGDYWLSVSQLDSMPLELGGAAYRASCDWIGFDASANRKHKFVMNYPALANRFAVESFAGSGIWSPFFGANNFGVQAYETPDSLCVRNVASDVCGTTTNIFNEGGSWTPMIRPYFGNRTFGPFQSDFPVELSALSGKFLSDHIALDWSTASELHNAGFQIDRRIPGDSAWLQINSAIIAGHNTTAEEHFYAYNDNAVQRGVTYEYRLRQIDNDGAQNPSHAIEVTAPPIDYQLMQNFPDPFSTSTQIIFALPHDDQVRITVSDLLGRTVRVLDDEVKSGGVYQLTWSGTNENNFNVPAGTYVLSMQAGEKIFSKMVHVLR